MKIIKKLFAVLLSLTMLICVLPMSALTASAATNPYGQYQTINGVTTVRCTWYAWEQAYNNTGAIMPNFGNAKNWYTSAQNNGFSVGSTPKAKSIAVWTNSNYGHVGYVVSVNGSTITVNEGGMLDKNGNAYNGTGIINGSVCNSAVGSNKSSYSSSVLVGYIYLTENNSVGDTVTLISQPDKNTITDNNAILWARVDKPSNYAVTKIGIKVREDGSTYDKGWEKYEAPSQSYVGNTTMYPYYNLNTELNANLKHATKYYCRFYAIINGKEYWSVEYYFTTTGSHAYNYKGFDATHPHRYYKKCACGDYYHLDEYKDYYSECVYCNTTYTIKYDANGGLNAPASQSKKYDKDITLSSQVPTRNGYKFLGWATAKTATAKNYSSGQTYSQNANLTLYAVWENCQHTSGVWKQNKRGWWYAYDDGCYEVGWKQIKKVWYYFDNSGWMQTGWVKEGNTWYYLKSSGAMQTGWLKTGGKWYYFKSSGAMQTGWLKTGGKWYYLTASGSMVTGSRTINGKVYNFNSSGVCLNP